MNHVIDMEFIDLDNAEGRHYAHLVVARESLIEEGYASHADFLDTLIEPAIEAILAIRFGRSGVRS